MKIVKEFSVINKDGKTIRGISYIPEKQGVYPTVIFSHGFNGNFKGLQHHGDGFAEAGIVCIFFDFCGGGMESTSDGSMLDMTVSSEVADLMTVIEYAKELEYVDENRLFLQGESQGGLISALTAAKMADKVSGLILWYPAFVIPDGARERYNAGITEVFGVKIGADFDIEAKDIDVYSEIAGYQGPVTIIHGDKDAIVPLSYSERALEVYKDASLHVIRNAGHGYDGQDSIDARNLSAEFICHVG